MDDRTSRTRILDSALTLIESRGGADVTMAEIAQAADVSRQAIYLHFANRAALLLAVVRHVDERRGLPEEVRKIVEAQSGTAALEEMVSVQARMNPRVWAVARAIDAVRRRDAEVERSWQDRLANRLRGCREIVARLAREGNLRPGLGQREAADCGGASPRSGAGRTSCSSGVDRRAVPETPHRPSAQGADRRAIAKEFTSSCQGGTVKRIMAFASNQPRRGAPRNARAPRSLEPRPSPSSPARG